MSVCLYAHISPEPRVQTSPIFVHSISDGVAIRYVFPVLCMTSRLPNNRPDKGDASDTVMTAPPQSMRNCLSVLCCTARHAGVMRVIPGCRLRVEIQFNTTGEWLWAEYDNMTVQSESDNYRLHVTGYRGNADDAFNRGDQWDRRRSNGMEFSTKDVDNDQQANRNCAKRWKCGWWFNSCSSSSLNCLGGKWLNQQHQSKPRASRMMLQCDAG